MPTEHIVEQGETLQRIAKQYGFGQSSSIYEHPSNAQFRKLRPNQDVIFPGDKINIPDKEDKIKVCSSDGRHSFTVKKPELEKLRIKIQKRSGEAWSGMRAVLSVGDQTFDAPIADDGIIELALPNGDESIGELKVFTLDDIDEPTDIFKIKIAHIDPVEEDSGIQARCHLLGYDAGEINGEIGDKTRKALRSFQRVNDLESSGEGDSATLEKLVELCGL